MPGKFWTAAQEEHLLSRRREGATLIVIAGELGLPLAGVRHKAARLQAGIVPRKRGWSKLELRRLRALWPRASWETLDRAFPGRTREGVSAAAAVHGVRREVRFAFATEELARIERLTDTELAYMAGLIDGEGSIVRTKTGHVSMSLGSTCHAAIEYLQSKVGGSASFYATGSGLGTKPFWRWHFTKTWAVLRLCERMKPYLIIKAGYPINR